MSTVDLRDAYHMFRVALGLQKYYCITPFYGSQIY